MKIFILLILFISVTLTDFGNTEIKLSKVSGSTVVLTIHTQNEGTTEGSDLSITNLKLFCGTTPFPITCQSSKQYELSSAGTSIQCSIDTSITSAPMCVLFDIPTIHSTGDTFKVDPGVCCPPPKFGDVSISLVEVEGKKVVIKITPEITGTTATDDLTISGLTVQSKALTCKPGKIISLEVSTGTNIECSTTEEIEANLNCKLSGSPKITSTDDTFGAVSITTNSITSSFGTIKVGLNSIQGTYISLLLTPEYEGEGKIEISGLKLNDTNIQCPPSSTKTPLKKEGIIIDCSVNNAIAEEDVCVLSVTNSHINLKSKLIIDEEKKTCVARNSKYGKVYISLKNVIGSSITLLIKTTIPATTESSKFTINDLKLSYDKYEKTMTCVKSSKITFTEEGYDFTCSIISSVNGGKECSIKGVPTFISEGDTFSDLIVSNSTVLSSFGDITLGIYSIIGKNVRLTLSSVYSGTTKSKVNSINNLKLELIGETVLKDLTCEINTNIDFSSKDGILCELGEESDGNVQYQLKGEEPKIITPDYSRDVFGKILLKTTKATSSFGKLEISLVSVIGRTSVIRLKSQYSGLISSIFRISNLYVSDYQISCSTEGVSLELSSDSTSEISCDFINSYYSQETNITSELTGTPTTSLKLFSSQIITSDNIVLSGVRNFGDTRIYLHSIKGTTVYIEMKPSLPGRVRPIISNLKLSAGTETLDVRCDVTENIQLYSSQTKKIKCYIKSVIDSNTVCRLLEEEANPVLITTDTGDTFGNAIIDTDGLIIKPTSPTYGNTKITLNKIIGTEIKIDISVSSTTIINVANPVIHNLYLGGNELICIASQSIQFTDNKGQMSCTSSQPITCTYCQLTGTPTIVSLGDSEESFGQATLETVTVAPTASTLGAISITLQEVIGNYVYIGVSSANDGTSSQQVDINNLYVDGQLLTCSSNIKFSTSITKVQCTVKEPIAYNKNVVITGTPSIKIYSETESADVIQISEAQAIKASSNSALILRLISVKENLAIISIDATDVSKKTLFENFVIRGLAINDIPFDIELDEIYLGGGAIQTPVKLNQTVERDIPCSLNGVSSAQILAEGNTFGPITSNSGIITSSTFKFGEGVISLYYVQGYSVILNIRTTKDDYTKNTVINDLYINNIPLICQLNDDIELVTNEDGTDVECLLGTPIDGDIYCTLKYSGNGDDNFEKITINESRNSIYSAFKNFGALNLGLISVNGKNVKIYAKATRPNVTTTDNFEIKNLYINGKELSCKINNRIEFVSSGNQLECSLLALDSSETFTLTGENIKVISLADSFEKIGIDEKNNTVSTAPKNVDALTVSLSSVAGDKATLKLTSSNEIYTNIILENLKIKNKETSVTYPLTCPKVYIQLIEKNSYTQIIKCNTITIITRFSTDITFSLVDDKTVKVTSYDDFDNIIIETNEVKSTTFGDIIINYVSSLIVLEVISTYSSKTTSPLYINNIQIGPEMLLDCGTLEEIDLKETGTKVYCTLKGTIKVEGVNDKLPYLEAGDTDEFGNTLLEKKLNNLQSTDCYSIYDQTSCEQNPSCVFTNITYEFCENKLNTVFNWNDTTNENDNECLLYINEDTCNNKDKCFWNKENIYSCKKKEINNCVKLSETIENKCETCADGYELNSERTKCIGDEHNDTVYPCSEYSGYYTCNNKAQCSYIHEPYNYCSGNNLEETINNKCYLYIEHSSCNSQKGCSWKIHSEEGCREKYIDNCIKLKESDPTSCEKCADGYKLLSGKACKKEELSESQLCEKYKDDYENCVKYSFCEYSEREYCYGNENCYIYLDKTRCTSGGCYWGDGDWEESCKVKKIDHCLILSKSDVTSCQTCEKGYYLYNSKYCYENSVYDTDDFRYCYEYVSEKDRCLQHERCEFSKRNYCKSRTDSESCGLYLDKSLCEENKECYWFAEEIEEEICQIRAIDNCMELSSEESYQCLKCKDGYELYNEKTECRTSQSQFINTSLIILGFILLLL